MNDVRAKKLRGKRFLRARRSVGLTQLEVARECGVAKSTVCAWEKGNQFPRQKPLRRFAALTATDVGVLFA